MEIRRWHYYIIFNCFLIQYLEAKTFSLNDVIAAESRDQSETETKLPPKLSASGNRRGSLIKRLKSSKVRQFLASNFAQDKANPGDKILLPLKHKKSFQIKNPLKPRKLKLIQKSRHKRKNQSTKGEFNDDGKPKQKDIPLLKSLSLLFDNLLNSDTSESVEIKAKKYKRNRFYSDDIFELPCFTDKSDYRYFDSKPKEKAVTTSPSPATEISVTSKTRPLSETASASANYTSSRDVGTFRQNTNIPILLSRNTFSSQRNDNGYSQRSSTTFHRNIEGHISRNNGDHEHNTGIGENASNAEDDEKDSDSDSRNGTRGFRSPRRKGNSNNTRILSRGIETNASNSKNETANDGIRENQFENRRNETKSSRILQESVRRLRGFPEDDIQSAESVWPKEIHEKSFINVTNHNTSNKRISDRSSTVTTENQEVRKGNETITLMGIKTNSTINNPKSISKKSPVVMIFDGYSITRHKNGENKFSEKSIRIRS